jgi:hypothetical protein
VVVVLAVVGVEGGGVVLPCAHALVAMISTMDRASPQ